MGIFSRRRRIDAPAAAPETPAGPPPPDLSPTDLALLERLRGLGADLSRPRHVVYYCHAPDRASARRVGDVAIERGFEVVVEPPAGDRAEEWAVRCEATTALRPEIVRGNTDFFEGLAQLYDVTYDGWDALVR